MSQIKWKVWGIVMLAGIWLGGVGCQKEISKSTLTSSGGGIQPAPNPIDPNPVVPISVNGTFSGQTSQGKPVTLWVTSNNVTKVYYEIRVPGAYCTSTVSSTWTINVPLSASYEFQQSGTDSVIQGKFSGASTASGTLMEKSTYCYGQQTVTWTVNKISSSSGISSLAVPSGKTVVISDRDDLPSTSEQK